MKKKFYTMLVLSCLPAAVLFAGGCRRSELNYQIAESIGTVGKYDNNEPVRSPKMRGETGAGGCQRGGGTDPVHSGSGGRTGCILPLR